MGGVLYDIAFSELPLDQRPLKDVAGNWLVGKKVAVQAYSMPFSPGQAARGKRYAVLHRI